MRPEEQVAYALETEPELLPWIPELLADLPALGSDPDEIVELLGELLPGGGRVLDLGCGKGAVSVALASQLGLRVQGVDLFEPFIEICLEEARRAGVGHLCKFRCADLRVAVEEGPPADAVVFLALGDLLGPLDATVALLRRAVVAGGVLVIGDAFLRDPDASGSGDYAGYAGHEESLRRLTACGDRLVREELVAPEELVTENRRNNVWIRARAERLVAARPELADGVWAFVERQEEECRILEREMVCVTWVLERAEK